MRRRLVVVAEAERQIRQAAAWWAVHRPAARGLFRQELTQAFHLIATQPGIGTKALDTALQGVRRLNLFRIRYYLFYRAPDEESVEVLAIWHASRGEGPPL